MTKAAAKKGRTKSKRASPASARRPAAGSSKLVGSSEAYSDNFFAFRVALGSALVHAQELAASDLPSENYPGWWSSIAEAIAALDAFVAVEGGGRGSFETMQSVAALIRSDLDRLDAEEAAPRRRR